MMERKLKDSGILWIGQIPEHWEIEKAKNIFCLRTSKGNDVLEHLAATQTNGMYPQRLLEGVVQVAINTDYTQFRTVHVNDYVISLRSFQGGFEISAYEGVCSPAYQVFYNKVQICHDYYKILFKSVSFIEFMNSLTVGIREGKNIQYSDFSVSYLPFPPLAEQEAIAAYLDKKCGEIDELIEVEQQMIFDLESYRQSVITEAVTHGLNPYMPQKLSSIRGIEKIPTNWNEVNLLKVIYLRARLGWRGLKAEEYVDKGYPFLSAFNIVSNQLIWDNLNFINQQRYDESPEIKLSLHDILIVKDGAGIGKCARVEDMPLGESTVNSSLGVITVSEILYYSYLFYFFLSTPFQDNVLFLKNGMGVPHLTQENLKTVRIPLPPVEEQKAIADYLDAKCTEIDDLIKVKQEKIETLKQYRQSLIFEAVTGKTSITINV